VPSAADADADVPADVPAEAETEAGADADEDVGADGSADTPTDGSADVVYVYVDDGCGCRTTGTSEHASLVLFGLLFVAAFRRRRRT